MILKVKQPDQVFTFYSGLTDLTFFSSQDDAPRYFYCSDGMIYHQIKEDNEEVKWLPVETVSGTRHWDLGIPPSEWTTKEGESVSAYVPICAVEAFRDGQYERWYFWEAFLMSEEGRTIERLY